MTTLRGRMPEADWQAFALDALGRLAGRTAQGNTGSVVGWRGDQCGRVIHVHYA